MSRSTLVPAIAVLAAVAALAPLAASAEPISVVVDRAKVMRISRPADIVIIGNPSIADATIQDAQTLIITGRSYGTTNLIILDAAGQAIADEVVTVSPTNDQVVTVYRRASRQTLSCTPDCSPTLALGDNSASFSSTTTQIQAARSLANSGSSAGQ